MDVLLFPLTSLSLQPGSLKPLNFFEPRYKRMLETSLEEGLPIALVYGHPKDNWPAPGFDKLGDLEIPHESIAAIRRTACAGLPHVVQRSNDGSILVSLEGQYKVWIEKHLPLHSKTQRASSLKGRAIELSEETQLSPKSQLMYRLIEKDFREWIETSSPQLKEHPLYQKMFQTPASIASLYTDLVIKDPVIKQLVLEAQSLDQKLELLARVKVEQRINPAGRIEELHP